MIFALVFLFLIMGVCLSGFIGLLPLQMQIMIPDIFRFLLFFVGAVISSIGVIILRGRADKTDTIHLLEYGRPGTVNWFYFYKDGTMKITPSIRDIESQLYSKELDAQITELKSYKLFDHSIRIVPEGVGHAADLDMVLYANLFKSKWGFRSIPAARKSIFNTFFDMFKQPDYRTLPKEHLMVQDKKEEEDESN